MNWTLCTTRGSLALADSGPQALTVPARGLPGTAGSSVVLASAIRVCAGHTTGRVWAQPLPVGLGVQGHHDGHRRRGAHEVPEPVARRLRTRIRVSGSAHRTVTRHCGKEPTGSLRRPLTRRDSAEAAAWEDTVTVTNFEGTVTSGWHPGCESVFFCQWEVLPGRRRVIFIDQGPLNETRPSSSSDAEPPQAARVTVARPGLTSTEVPSLPVR